MVYLSLTTPLFKLLSLRLMSLPEENELEGLQRLDPQAISALYDRYFPEVYRFVCYRLNDESLAEDLASEVFVRLLSAVKSGRGPQTNLKGWLVATTYDYAKSEQRLPSGALPETLPDVAPGPAQDYEKLERERRLQKALATLTSDQQYVINLRFNQGYSLEETAVLMKKNANAVKQLQFRALSALNRALGEMP